MSSPSVSSPAVELAAALRTGEIGSQELLDAYLARIDGPGAALNAVVTLDAERARQVADERDAQRARGESTGPLHGLPITVKDAIEVAGLRSAAGAAELRDHVPAQDAPAVRRLRDAGAVVFGKTNVPRWCGDLQTVNEPFGRTLNPWDPERTPGGSSGGAAAAVSAGLTAFELGTDIGGSVRLPAHFCGVFGLKPSYGVVCQRGYLDQVGGGTTDVDMNVFGPLARDVSDLDLLLDVLAGPSPEHAAGWRLALPPPRTDDVRRLRVATWTDDPACPVDPAYRAVLDDVADRLADAGARMVPDRPAVAFTEQVGVYRRLLAAAVSPTVPPDLREHQGGNHFDWLTLLRRRAELAAVWHGWFADVDVLLCPVTLGPAFRHLPEENFFTRTLDLADGGRPYQELADWAGLITLVGLPSVSAPVGRTAAGLPVGVQVVAGYLQDRTAIAAARIVTEVVGGGYRTPPGFR